MIPAVLPSGGDGVDGDVRGGEDRVPGDLPPVQGLQDQKAGHDLGQAGGIEPLVDVPGVEDLLRVRVNEQGCLGGNLPVPHVVLRGQGGGGEPEEQNTTEKKREKAANFHIILHKSMVYWS